MNEKSLYSEIELLIIQWNIDGTKTAGSLTRKILKLISLYQNNKLSLHHKIMENYKDKNNTILTYGNIHADKLLCMLENNAVLSDKLTQKIRDIIFVILTNHANNIDYINNKIISLIAELKWMYIFSDKFITELECLLKDSLNFEIQKK